MGALVDSLPLIVAAEEEGGSFLVSPGLGLMIWTLIAFLATYFILKKFAFPRIQEALEKRANAVAESIDAAKRTREEADDLLQEYRERLREAREQAEDIVHRARPRRPPRHPPARGRSGCWPCRRMPPPVPRERRRSGRR